MTRKYDACPLCGTTKDARAKRCKKCFHKTRPRTPLETRFWQGVDKRGPDECWPWKNTEHTGDYGRMRTGGREGDIVLATHVSYEIHKGPLPEGYHACHTCDWPPCCNPAHLFAGTQHENNTDRHNKGRDGRAFGLSNGAHTHPEKVARGSTHYAAKLTDEQVTAIRASKPAKRVHQTAEQIAVQYGISKPHVIHIWYGHKWKHL